MLQDLIDIGIDIRGHRKKLLREIEQLPFVELDNNVPVSRSRMFKCFILLSGV